MITKKTIQRICQRLQEKKPIQQKLPNEGILFIEKLLPYICIYRFKQVDPYFSGLLKTQASYLIVSEEVDIVSLLKEISQTLSKVFDAFLIFECWPLRTDHDAEFEIFCPDGKAPATVAALREGFDSIADIYPTVSVKITNSDRRHPKDFPALITNNESNRQGSLVIGIAVPTIYERTENDEVYSLFYRKFYSQFSETIKRAAFEFIRVQTSNPFNHYLMLGKTQIDAITKKADAELAKISEGMSFLLRTTPVNSSSEWKKFKKNNFKLPPSFNYRLIALDPELKKRKLYDLPIDKVEDPTIAFILRDKRLEIEKQLTMLEERGTLSFRYIGESIYGKVDEATLRGATAILKKYPRGNDPKAMQLFDCHEFAAQAKIEMEYYQERFPDLKLQIEIRKDVAGIMVSKSKLLISDQYSMDANRCDALIQHEIGTHILTYCNGRSQPLKQLYAGFAGYDEMQEGLAVLAEYLVGGLTINRLRLLAARVVAAKSLVEGNGFIDTFKLLHRVHHFPERVAYYITMRIYRGGGLTKDAVYLAGFMKTLQHVKNHKNFDTLYTGKFNFNHIELIEELLHRGILKKAVTPRFLERPSVKERLQKIKNGIKITELLD